jgi:hypothetical protein
MTRFIRLSLVLICIMLLAAQAPAAGAAPPAMPPADGYLGGCNGEYFNNISLSGSPVMVRTDGAVNFFWPEGTSPGGGVSSTQYSVRWTCSVNAPSDGSYTFTMTTDDGMNVLVDGNLVMWAWYDQGPSTYSQTISLGAGGHTVVVQYYNNGNAGTARVTSTLGSGGVSSGSFPDWQGDYFNNASLSGAPTISRNDLNVNFNWGGGSPDPSIPADYFSVRWTRTLNFAGGTWQFTTTTDDGVRLWVDGNLLIDQWHAQGPTAYSANVALAAGSHTVRMEYFENTGNALAQLNYSQVSGGGGGVVVGVWVGQYFNNISLSGAPVYLLNTPGLNFGFNWGGGSPAYSVPVDYFSAKWDAYQNIVTTGNYTIVANSDDGIRVWLDGALVIDGWYDHSSTTFTAVRNLGAGLHAFHVEYYERTGTALVSVQIVPGSTGGPPPGGGEAVVDDLGPGWQAGGASANWRGAATGVNGHAFWTFNNTYAASFYNWARWYPALGAPGNYEVFAFVPSGLGSTLNARYWVYHAGRYDLAPRSQVFYGNQWMSLGTYYFSAAGGNSEFVSLSDVTYECYLCRTIAFDAVKFSPR